MSRDEPHSHQSSVLEPRPTQRKPLPSCFHSSHGSKHSSILELPTTVSGMPLPSVRSNTPASLIMDTSTESSNQWMGHSGSNCNSTPCQPNLKRVHAHVSSTSHGSDQLFRVKLACTSPIVLAAWNSVAIQSCFRFPNFFSRLLTVLSNKSISTGFLTDSQRPRW